MNKLSNISIRRLIVLPIMLIVLVSIFLTGFFFIKNENAKSVNFSHSLQNEITSRIQLRTNLFLNQPYEICELTYNLISTGILDPSNQTEMECFFLQLIKIFPQISSIYFGNSSGGLIDVGRERIDEYYVVRTENYLPGTFSKYRISTNGNLGKLLSEIPDFDARIRPWYSVALESSGQVVRSNPFVVFTNDDISISTSKAAFDSLNSFVGVISSDIFLRHISGFLGTIDVGETGLSFIADSQGRILASSLDSGNSEKFGLLPAKEYNNFIIKTVGLHIDSLFGCLSNVNSLQNFEINCNSTSYFIQILPFNDSIGKSYFTVTVLPKEDFIELIGKSKNSIIVLLFVSLFFALVVGILVARLIAKPIHDLNDSVKTMQRTGKKDFPTHWMREVNDLSLVFGQLITLLNNTMQDLKESKERMSLALKGTQAATWDWNIVTGEIKVNDRWAEIIGYSLKEIKPITSEKWYANIHKDDIEDVRKKVSNHFKDKTVIYDATYRIQHKNKNWIWILDRGMVVESNLDGTPLRMAGAHLDVTLQKNAEIEKQKLQKQVNKAQNLESVGQLAGGVAHDLNNLLTPIIGYSELILSEIDSEIYKKQLNEVLRASISAKHLVSQLLAFGRKQHLEFVTIDLNTIIKNFASLIRRTIRENIRISFSYSNDLLYIDGDVMALEQVLMNLTVNAQDAMAEGGDMSISLKRILSSKSVNEENITEACAQLEIKDNGIGMNKETIDKIFTPFFTTKEGKGTGMGLATTYGIIKQHNGTIEVESKVGFGTTFRVKIPISKKLHLESISTANSKITGGNETILLVEDNKEVKEIAYLLLKRLGYTVHTASNGLEALSTIQNKDNSIDLILSDIIMPGLSIEEFYNEVVKLIPNPKIIFMSGYAGDVIKKGWLQKNSFPFIAKPFSFDDLATIVRKVLERNY